MKIAIFDTHRFEQPIFEASNESFQHQLTYLEPRLTAESVDKAKGFDGVCCFTSDILDLSNLQKLKEYGIKIIALRSAGFNHVDLTAAAALGLRVVRVPAYSPYSVAEHAVALILGLNRKLFRSATRVHELNFSLDGLVGFDLHGKTVGIVGTGKIGAVLCKIMTGFGCRVIAYDPIPHRDCLQLGVQYQSLDQLYAEADIISLHVPLSTSTFHLINAQSIAKMKPGVMLINTGRGKLIDTHALIEGIKSGHVGYAGLDVYEEEESIFFHDLSNDILQDDQFARLLTFPNVLITSHQGFLTEEALKNIVETTLQNIDAFAKGKPLLNEVKIS